jgi:hypothetical protein|tara:strand:- start:1495 stop:1758 length:264 start_codon:yes stop_codon:yes gene_type:complete
LSVFKQLHEIVFHGKGGYDHQTVYNMPLWLRKYTFHQINEFYTKENENVENANKGKGQSNVIDSEGKVNTPDFLKGDNSFKGKSGYK